MMDTKTCPDVEKAVINCRYFTICRKSSMNPNDCAGTEGYDLLFYWNSDLIASLSISSINSESPFLYNFYVEKPFRHQGFGTAILRYVMKEYRVGTLTVDRDNKRAIKLYKKLGFKKVRNFSENGIPRMYMRSGAWRGYHGGSIVDRFTDYWETDIAYSDYTYDLSLFEMISYGTIGSIGGIIFVVGTLATLPLWILPYLAFKAIQRARDKSEADSQV